MEECLRFWLYLSTSCTATAELRCLFLHLEGIRSLLLCSEIDEWNWFQVGNLIVFCFPPKKKTIYFCSIKKNNKYNLDYEIPLKFDSCPFSSTNTCIHEACRWKVISAIQILLLSWDIHQVLLNAYSPFQSALPDSKCPNKDESVSFQIVITITTLFWSTFILRFWRPLAAEDWCPSPALAANQSSPSSVSAVVDWEQLAVRAAALRSARDVRDLPLR